MLSCAKSLAFLGALASCAQVESEQAAPRADDAPLVEVAFALLGDCEVETDEAGAPKLVLGRREDREELAALADHLARATTLQEPVSATSLGSLTLKVLGGAETTVPLVFHRGRCRYELFYDGARQRVLPDAAADMLDAWGGAGRARPADRRSL